MKIQNLTKKFGSLRALDNVSMELVRGKTLALVGESGSGKTTLGRCLLRLIDVDSGHMEWNGIDIADISERNFRAYRNKIQMIFQDPFSSLNPRKTIEAMLFEILMVHKLMNPVKRVGRLLDCVGLAHSALKKYPHEFSGGQRQRLAIARALATEPEIIVCDEPTSSLDVSIQAQILNLLKDLQSEFKLTYLFITHDLPVARYMANRVAVMYYGKIIEVCDANNFFEKAEHPYSRALIASIPSISINQNSKSASDRKS